MIISQFPRLDRIPVQCMCEKWCVGGRPLKNKSSRHPLLLLPSLSSTGLPRLVNFLRDEGHLNFTFLSHLVNATPAPALVPPTLPLPFAPVQPRPADAPVDGKLKTARPLWTLSCPTAANLL